MDAHGREAEEPGSQATPPGWEVLPDVASELGGEPRLETRHRTVPGRGHVGLLRLDRRDRRRTQGVHHALHADHDEDGGNDRAHPECGPARRCRLRGGRGRGRDEQPDHDAHDQADCRPDRVHPRNEPRRTLVARHDQAEDQRLGAQQDGDAEGRKDGEMGCHEVVQGWASEIRPS